MFLSKKKYQFKIVLIMLKMQKDTFFGHTISQKTIINYTFVHDGKVGYYLNICIKIPKKGPPPNKRPSFFLSITNYKEMKENCEVFNESKAK